jgi:hypothetical protein
MTGSTAAVISIPIVAFLLLIIWLSLVFYADSHPQWRGRQPMPAQRMTFLPNAAEIMGADPPTSGAVAGSPPSQPAGKAASAEPEPPTHPIPAVPGQRQPIPIRQPAATAGATAVAGRRPGSNSSEEFG